MEIRKLLPADWPEVSKIYFEGMQTGNATFETSLPTWEQWDQSHLAHSRYVAIDNDQIIGWVALSPVSDRCIYGGVAEVSIYIGAAHRGKKVGLSLMNKVIDSSEKAEIWTLTAAMMIENEGSAALHEKVGFRRLGYREKIGKLHGVWRDNYLYERRSKKVM